MADVCLMLEGTYPYVSGGVSSWVHQLISHLPNTTFTLVYFGARSDELLTPKYKLPSNVLGLQEVFLFDEPENKVPGGLELTAYELEALATLHAELHEPDPEGSAIGEARLHRFRQAVRTLFPANTSERRLFKALGSYGVWRQIVREYEASDSGLPFISFFYTWRSTHLPIYRALGERYPKARLYHALCTGYAGLAATQASFTHGAPAVITEHGIYAHERAIEIAQSDWIYDKRQADLALGDPTEEFKKWWIGTFRNISRMAYGASSETITLFEGNRRRQLRDGAVPERLAVIPNGINPKFKGVRRQNPSWRGAESGDVFRIGFVGRVVSIKDVKMLIKAIRAVSDEYPQIDCQIIGPTEEEPDYFKQCRELVEFLGMDKIIRFVGKKEVAEVYTTLDLVLLTSVSEAQPLVILEANCAGVPVVSTRVGSCQELLEGISEPDRTLGPSGLLSEIGDSEQTGTQILKIIRDPELWDRMSHAGIDRVMSFYTERDMIARYDLVYRKHMGGFVARPQGLGV